MTLKDISQVVFIVAGCTCLLVVTAKEMDDPKTIVKRVETCSPRSVDNYSPTELRRIAGARERLAKVK